MGYDLCGKKRRLGAKGYFRAGFPEMTLLRASMIAAGVDSKLVYKKFVGNDGLVVTALQATKISQRLSAWLSGKDVAVTMPESDENAMKVNRMFSEIVGTLSDTKRKARSQRMPSARPSRHLLDKESRKFVKQFAQFCAISGEFSVD